MHVCVDVQILAEEVLAEAQVLKQFVIGLRRRVAAVMLLGLVRF